MLGLCIVPGILLRKHAQRRSHHFFCTVHKFKLNKNKRYLRSTFRKYSDSGVFAPIRSEIWTTSLFDSRSRIRESTTVPTLQNRMSEQKKNNNFISPEQPETHNLRRITYTFLARVEERRNKGSSLIGRYLNTCHSFNCILLPIRYTLRGTLTSWLTYSNSFQLWHKQNCQ